MNFGDLRFFNVHLSLKIHVTVDCRDKDMKDEDKRWQHGLRPG